MNRSHLAYCGVGIVLAVVLLLAVGVSTTTLGFLALALACPLMMLVMMRQMMGSSGPRSKERKGEPAEPAGRVPPADEKAAQSRW